jgi:hypothetical protein
MANMLTKIFGTTFAALVLSTAGAGPAQAGNCLKCVYNDDDLPGFWYCSTMWWFETGGGTICRVDQNGCNVSMPPGRTCS